MPLTITHEKQNDYEQVVKFTDDDFICYIAIHNTKLGPAVGGCRIKNYNSVEDARTDVLRLAKGMTYKSSLAGLNFGGGKAVVIADKPTRNIMLKVGEAINYFNGQYFSAEDVGTKLSDIQIAGEITPYVAKLDGSAMTARGVFNCMVAAYCYKYYDNSLDNVSVWIEGLGKVGMELAKYYPSLKNNDNPKVELYVSDLRKDVIKEAIGFGAKKITESKKKLINIYSPCAMGQVVNIQNVNSVKYDIICGSANNQLIDDNFADVLQNNNVLYCCDYLVNSGGIINAAFEFGKEFDQVACEKYTDGLSDKLLDVFAMAKSDKMNPLKASNRLAEERFK